MNLAILIETLLLKSVYNIFSKEQLFERMLNRIDVKKFDSDKRINYDDIISFLKQFNLLNV